VFKPQYYQKRGINRLKKHYNLYCNQFNTFNKKLGREREREWQRRKRKRR
jgi:hypothetical protein